jgi:hypothetical protein
LWYTNSSISIWWYGSCHSRTTAATEEYNGTSWTNSNPLNTAKRFTGGAGTQTSALAFGGANSSCFTSATEEYDGSSWTSNPLNTARRRI